MSSKSVVFSTNDVTLVTIETIPGVSYLVTMSTELVDSFCRAVMAALGTTAYEIDRSSWPMMGLDEDRVFYILAIMPNADEEALTTRTTVGYIWHTLSESGTVFYGLFRFRAFGDMVAMTPLTAWVLESMILGGEPDQWLPYLTLDVRPVTDESQI